MAPNAGRFFKGAKVSELAVQAQTAVAGLRLRLTVLHADETSPQAIPTGFSAANIYRPAAPKLGRFALDVAPHCIVRKRTAPTNFHCQRRSRSRSANSNISTANLPTCCCPARPVILRRRYTR